MPGIKKRTGERNVQTAVDIGNKTKSQSNSTITLLLGFLELFDLLLSKFFCLGLLGSNN